MHPLFYNLYVHSHYTLLKSTLSIDHLIKYSLDNKLSHVVLCDSNLYAAMDFYSKAKKQNLNPVIGLDFHFNNDHFLLFAKNNKGYHNLIKLHSLQNLNQLIDMHKFLDDLIVIQMSGKTMFSHENYHLSSDYAIQLVQGYDANDEVPLKILDAINHDKKIDDVDSLTHPFWFLTPKEAQQTFSSDQILNNQKLVESCNWEVPVSEVHLTNYPTPKNITSKIYIENLCVAGLKKRLGSNTTIPKNYVERLFYELKVINEMGFNDYFLIVQDFINFARRNDILVGAGRGSAAGSLVAYTLFITNVDPIVYNLIFERFLNPGRKSLPDIDIDIMDTRRQEVIDYIFNKYGPTQTAYIITFQHLKTKMAIRDVGRVLDISLPLIDKINKLLPYEIEDDFSSIEQIPGLKEIYNDHKNLFFYASKLLGIPRQISTHAAGVIIADKPLYEYIPIQQGIDGWNLSEFSMNYLEPLGLIKIDILGLKNLTIISEVSNLIWQNQAKKIDLDTIDLEDKKLFHEISQANTIGIFQLESQGMRNTLRRIKPRCIEDISITSALFRPGPQAMIDDYVKTRNGELEPQYLLDSLKPILEPTLGFCIYQEQVIELVRAVTGFSAAEADIFRRAISKKQENVFVSMQKPFINAARANGYTEDQAQEIFKYLLNFANYGFNHSHSLAYSFISYQMIYLKHYFPLEFHIVLLKYGDSSNVKNNLYIAEAKKRGIKICNVSILHSNLNFDVYNNGIIFGLANIKGLGNEIAKRIYEARQKYDFKTWGTALSILNSQEGISTKVLELLIKVGAFDEFSVDRNFLLKNLEEITAKANIKDPLQKTPIFDCVLSQDFVPMTEDEKASWEFKLLSYTFSNNKWDELFTQHQKQYHLAHLNSDKLSEIYQNQYLIKINNISVKLTKYNKKMAFIEFSTNDVDFSTVSFSETVFNTLSANNYYVCKFKLGSEQKIQLHSVTTQING